MDPELLVDDDMEPNPALNKVTNAILGAAFEVHTQLGPGYPESFYEKALAIEFNLRGMRFVRQATFPVVYKGELVGEGRADFIVEDSIILEIKTVEAITHLFVSQVVSYQKATRKELALIINFNVKRLKDGIRRVAHKF